MATSVYFNNFSPSVINEHMLLEDLIVESIQIMGHDIKYMPREVYDMTDDVLGESVNSKFTRAYNLEMYLANVEGYEGDGDFFSKFGLEIRDTSNFVVSRRTFEKYVPSQIATRPREGDLIFVPLLGKIFEIKFVEEELQFFSLGKRKPYMYEIRCEVFRSSNEDFNTGTSEVDDIESTISYAINLGVNYGTGDYYQNEIVYQGANLTFATAAAEVKKWIGGPSTQANIEGVPRNLEVYNIRGNFEIGANVIGTKSNAVFTLITFDDLADITDFDDSDNRIIQTEAESFIDLSEINPFGVP
jgi:hypothetical protein